MNRTWVIGRKAECLERTAGMDAVLPITHVRLACGMIRQAGLIPEMPERIKKCTAALFADNPGSGDFQDKGVFIIFKVQHKAPSK